MKTYTLLVVLLFSQLIHSFSQWTLQTSPTTNNLKDVAFFSSRLGYAVGDKGTILKTVNGGRTWQILPSPDTADLLSITIIDSNTVMVTSSNTYSDGSIYKSTTQGNSWHKVLHDNKSFYAAKAGNSKVFGVSAHIYESDDVGETWFLSDSLLNSTSTYNEIAFSARDTGMVGGNISGIATYSAEFVRSVNGGINWYKSNPFSFPNADAFSSFGSVNSDSILMFTNAYKGFSPGDTSELLLLTKFHLKRAAGDTVWSFAAKPLSRMLDVINDCQFFEGGLGYATGERGTIYRTTTYGKKWIKESTGNPSLNSIFMLSTIKGFAVGDNGRILKRDTTNALAQTKRYLSMNVYPNPANSYITINFELEKHATLSIELVNEQSIVVYRGTAKNYGEGSQQITMPVINFVKGTYHINLISDGVIVAEAPLLIIH